MLNRSNNIWQVKDDPPSASWLAGKLGISKLLATLLIHRNVPTPDAAQSFLFPKLGALRDPFLFKDMDRAVELISTSIKNNKRITVYGDYDADGITATALLVDFFSQFEIPISFYIPHRLQEGYSLNEAAIREIAAGDTKLIITVDCGISSPSEIDLAKSLGLEVVVTDHHQLPAHFEPRCPTINPFQPDCPFPFQGLSGVGLAFYLVIAIRADLRESGYFGSKGEPDLRPYLDLVALGTVADIVPLIEENRILVKNGLSILRESQRPGIKELLRVSGINMDREITTYDIAFKLAPRLNAMGRLGSVTRAVQLLTTDNEKEAAEIATDMDSLNTQRQTIESRILFEVRERITRIDDLERQRTIVLSDPSWHRGIVGIVASKIVEEHYRPTLILEAEGELLRGSGRSINGFDLYQALFDLSGLLKQFGGHGHAAGVTLEAKNLREFCKRFEELARKRIDPKDMAPKIDADARLGLESISPRLLRELEMLPPFGDKNPQPVFWAGPLEVVFSRVVGNDHLKLRIKEKGITFDCIAFGKGALHPLGGKSVDILFQVGTNTWQGIESIQLVIVDIQVN
ncbi:MAG: single-stranded-DNA-specific exonuclease RecJ [Deltaproteobacteria bacterium]|nr:single-stranded-DNA-specific exonuclease RecJ [Deltaproteobacteria bacterium]MBW2339956.1 single-stranded-DNA-specific exonuclease RecJ [Deltaproteobacteria bacterium]